MPTETFTVNRVATSGCEIRDLDGLTIAWTTVEPWAIIIAGLLNRVGAEGLECLPDFTSDGGGLAPGVH